MELDNLTVVKIRISLTSQALIRYLGSTVKLNGMPVFETHDFYEILNISGIMEQKQDVYLILMLGGV